MISTLRFPKTQPQKPRKIVRCKGIIPGTNIKCRAELCETDGELLFVSFGLREISMVAKKTDNPFLICEHCGHQTMWHRK
jgi:hypothetical protein